jgi:chromosome segregation ATPase
LTRKYSAIKIWNEKRKTFENKTSRILKKLSYNYKNYLLFPDLIFSTKKTDLEDLIEHINIQIDNPVCFLNQETSKTFLRVTDSVLNYQLFMRASQLEQSRDLLEKSTTKCNESELLITEKEAQLAIMETQLFASEQAYKNSLKGEKLGWRLRSLWLEHTSAIVRDSEKAIDGMKQKLLSINKSISVKKSKLKEEEAALEQVVDELELAERETKLLDVDIKVSQDNVASGTEQAKQLARDLASTRNELHRLENSLQDKQRRQRHMDSSLRDAQVYSKEMQAYEESVRSRDEKLSKAHGKIAENSASVLALEQRVAMLTEKIGERNREIRELGSRAAEGESQLKTLDQDIFNMVGSSKDRALLFGQFMPRLLQDIEESLRDGRFKNRPLGKFFFWV